MTAYWDHATIASSVAKVDLDWQIGLKADGRVRLWNPNISTVISYLNMSLIVSKLGSYPVSSGARRLHYSLVLKSVE